METDAKLAEKLTKVYLKIKTKRAELASKFKEEDEKLTKQLDKVKSALLEYCKEQGVDSVRTTEGLFYRSVRTKYWTNDWDSMYRFVIDNNMPEVLEKRINQGHMRQLLEENPELVPPGLNTDSEYVISVRRK